ncbi:13488_t:CDS:1 [Funneliformis geosporum]|uniref:13488_t:CDS:1 n=1 Tax=Funneliformis geosporum TaxID=1117311 RepID=A0A9W4SDE2_9GLOM|nr:13488_t:CDS:1 [Funneliformis geosporum]
MPINATWILLNTLRVLSIISLMLVITTCIIVNVKGFPGLGKSNTIFQFFNRCFIAVEALILIFTELGWPRRIFHWFPMLDDSQTWTFFGFLQTAMGSLILGYDSGIGSQSFLGQSLFLFIVVPGWFVFIIGIIYMLCGTFGGVSLRSRRALGKSEKSRPPPYNL